MSLTESRRTARIPYVLLDVDDALAGRIQREAGRTLQFGFSPERRQLREDDYDAVVTDRYNMGEITSQILVVILTDESADRILHLMASGIQAVLPRNASALRVLRAVDAVLEGDAVFPASVVNYARTTFFASHPHDIKLMDQEVEWLELLANGHPLTYIANHTNWSERHLRRRLNLLYARLGAKNRDQAVHLAGKFGLLARRTEL